MEFPEILPAATEIWLEPKASSILGINGRMVNCYLLAGSKLRVM
jgi:hypothetical protein